MAGRLILDLPNPSLTATGKVDSGATLTYYLNGTTTLQGIFADAGLLTPLNQNGGTGITCDAAGRFPIVWAPDNTSYSVKWQPTGVAPITFDDITPTATARRPSKLTYLSEFDSLADADAYVFANGRILGIDQDVTLTADTTLTSDVRACGGIITTGGHNLTITGTFAADVDSPVFEHAGTGIIDLQNCSEISLGWYSPYADGATADDAAIARAHKTLYAAKGGDLIWPRSRSGYKCGTIATDVCQYSGGTGIKHRLGKNKITYSGSSGFLFDIPSNYFPANGADHASSKFVAIDGEDRAQLVIPAGGSGIRLSDAIYNRVRGLDIKGAGAAFGVQLYISNGSYWNESNRIEGVHVWGCVRGFAERITGGGTSNSFDDNQFIDCKVNANQTNGYGFDLDGYQGGVIIDGAVVWLDEEGGSGNKAFRLSGYAPQMRVGLRVDAGSSTTSCIELGSGVPDRDNIDRDMRNNFTLTTSCGGVSAQLKLPDNWPRWMAAPGFHDAFGRVNKTVEVGGGSWGGMPNGRSRTDSLDGLFHVFYTGLVGPTGAGSTLIFQHERTDARPLLHADGIIQPGDASDPTSCDNAGRIYLAEPTATGSTYGFGHVQLYARTAAATVMHVHVHLIFAELVAV